MRYVGKDSQVYWPKNASQERLFRKNCSSLKFSNIVLLHGWQIVKLKTHAEQSQGNKMQVSRNKCSHGYAKVDQQQFHFSAKERLTQTMSAFPKSTVEVTSPYTASNWFFTWLLFHLSANAALTQQFSLEAYHFFQLILTDLVELSQNCFSWKLLELKG